MKGIRFAVIGLSVILAGFFFFLFRYPSGETHDEMESSETATLSKGNTDQVMVIHQSSRKAVLNLNDFNLESTNLRIETDHPDSMTLIRVNGGNPSIIRGKISSNGQIVLINPAGVMVSPEAVIDLDQTVMGSTLGPTSE